MLERTRDRNVTQALCLDYRKYSVFLPTSACLANFGNFKLRLTFVPNF